MEKFGGQPENPFKKADEIVKFIRGASEAELKTAINTLFDKWIPILFNASRASKGGVKLKYATAIRTTELNISEDNYRKVLSSINTTPEAIDELSIQATKEMNPLNKLKGFFT
jgi:hypothetical protein